MYGLFRAAPFGGAVLVSILTVFVLSGCQMTKPSTLSSTKIVLPDQSLSTISWSDEEKAKDFAIRPLFRDEYMSAVLMRMTANEPPHYHDRHDLAVTVIDGPVAINFEDRREVFQNGDVALIPKGTFHWAETVNGKAGVVFVTFTPPFDGKDRRMAASK